MALLKLLKTEAYTAVDYPIRHNQNFEDLNDYGGIAELFDLLKSELNRVPSQTEYIEAGLVRAEAFFNTAEPIYIFKTKERVLFKWDDDLIASVKNRLARTYRSMLIEESVIDYIKSRDGIKCASSVLIDMTFGADMVVMTSDNKKLFYIHVLSKWGVSYYREKGERKPYVVDKKGIKRYWKRNWGKAHKPLVFALEAGERMVDVNGNLIFTKEFLDGYFDKLLTSEDYEINNEKAEFKVFFQWVVKNKLDFNKKGVN